MNNQAIKKGSLNQQQFQAVTSLSGPLLIIAGAGTGKTKVITHRICQLIGADVAPEKIAALTFTNKAAKEMRNRVASLVKRKRVDLQIGTYHSFCLKFLRKHYSEAGVHPNFGIASSSDQIELIRKAANCSYEASQANPYDILTFISQKKNNLIGPEDNWSSDHWDMPLEADLLREIYSNYERHLRINRVIDFDDCIFKTVKTLKDESIQLRSQEQFTHFLVDEFQDTNHSQLTLLRLLVSKKNNICAVGDDDQSIYSWRGAVAGIMDEFRKSFPGTQTIKLEQNYRCSPSILNMANQLIKSNTGRNPKTLWSDNPDVGRPTYYEAEDGTAEARWISRKCLSILGQGKQLSDIAILYRTNQQAKIFEAVLRESNLRYRIYGGSSFFEKKETRDFLSYLRLSIDRTDRIAFFRIINTPPRGFGLKTLEKIEEAAHHKKISPFEVLEGKHIRLSTQQETAFNSFREKLISLKKDFSSPSPSIMVNCCKRIIQEFRLAEDIRSRVKDDNQRTKKLVTLNSLPQYFQEMFETIDADEGNKLQTFLDTILLQDESPQSEKNDNQPSISLMTIHRAKGLEFPVVFTAGLEEGILPHENSISEESGIEEERRLFYVAITRAKEYLFLTNARNRTTYQKNQKKKSRFLSEIDVLGQNSDDPVPTEETRQQNNLARFNRLKANLKSGFNLKK